MKKLIVLAVLVFGMSATAQGLNEAFLSASFDFRNAVAGSAPTNNEPALDALFKCGMVGEEGLEFQVMYEVFKKIEFSKYGLCVGHKIGITDELSTSILGELAWVKRDWGGDIGEVGNGSAGVALSTRYKISDKVGVELFMERLFRGDIDWRYNGNGEPWVNSVYVGVTYNIGGN